MILFGHFLMMMMMMMMMMMLPLERLRFQTQFSAV
jgi:hypothetical protein